MRKACLIFLTVFLLLIPFSLGALQLVSLEINEEIIAGPKPLNLTVTGTLSNGIKQQIREDLVWRSSDTTIAKVSSQGKLSFTGKEGAVTVFVNKGTASGKKTINVRAWPKSLKIESLLIYSENPYRLAVKGLFSDGTTRYYGPEDKISWISTNPWVAWVNTEGVVTFTGEQGYVSIKAISGEYSDFVNTTVDSDEETIVRPRKIMLKEEEIKYSAAPQQLTLVAVMPDNTEEDIEPSSASWYSGNREIAHVSGEGVLTFTGKPGVANLKVSYGGYHDETIVTVGSFIKEIKLNQTLNYSPAWDNTALPLSVTAIYNDGSKLIQTTNLSWSSSNDKVATLTEEGVLTFTGEFGNTVITVSGKGAEDNVVQVQDTVTVNVPPRERPTPYKVYIDQNPVSQVGFMTPRVYCLYANGEQREVTDQVQWRSLTPETASFYEGTIYFSPNPGQVNLLASFQGLTDTLTGYINGNNQGTGSYAHRVYQVRLKEHYVPFSFQPVPLTALAIKGGGSVEDVTAKIKWYSNQPLVAKVEQGVLTFTGRIGKATITVQGFGLRDSLSVEVRPEDLQPQIDYVAIEGTLTSGANQLKALAYYTDGSFKDVTKEAVWNTSNKNKALVTELGMVMFPEGLAPVTISAHYGGKGAEITRVE